MASRRCSLCAVNYPNAYGRCLRCNGVLRECADEPTPGWEDATVPIASDELGKVEAWRLHVLLEAGYPVELAEQLAASDVDLHAACQILERGCGHATAAAILL